MQPGGAPRCTAAQSACAQRRYPWLLHSPCPSSSFPPAPLPHPRPRSYVLHASRLSVPLRACRGSCPTKRPSSPGSPLQLVLGAFLLERLKTRRPAVLIPHHNPPPPPVAHIQLMKKAAALSVHPFSASLIRTCPFHNARATHVFTLAAGLQRAPANSLWPGHISSGPLLVLRCAHAVRLPRCECAARA